MQRSFFWSRQTPLRGRLSLANGLIAVALALLCAGWLTREHFLPWVSWHSEAAAFAAVLLTCWVGVARPLHGKQASPIAVPRLALPLLGFIAVAMVQFTAGFLPFLGDLVAVIFYSVLCLACMILGFNSKQIEEQCAPCRSSKHPADLLAITILTGALASAVMGCAQVFGIWEGSGWIVQSPELRRAVGNLGQPNQLATLIVMGLASVAYLHASEKLRSLTSVMIVFVLCAGLAATESRTGAIELAVVLLWWQVKRRDVANDVSGWAAPAVGLAFAAMFFLWPTLLNAMQLVGAEAVNRFAQGDVRLAVWTQLLEAIWIHPLRGWGILQVTEAHNAVAHDYPINNPFSYSHNLIMDWAVWMGLPIALVMVFAAAVWLWHRCRQTRQLLPWYGVAVAAALATHSMFEFPYAYAYFLAPVMYLLGVLEQSSGSKTLVRVKRPVAAIMLLSVTGALGWSAVEYLGIEEDFRIVRFEQLRIGRTPDNQPRPNIIMFTQLGALLSGSRIELSPNMSVEKLEQLRRLALRYPWVATQYRYALALALNGNGPEAVRQLQVIRWQRGEKLYQKIKREISGLAQSRYAELRTLQLP